MTLEDMIKETREMTEESINSITPRMSGYVREYVRNVPDFIKSIIVFGSVIGIGNTNDDSDLDMIFVVDDISVRSSRKEELCKFEDTVTEVSRDILIEDYDGFVEAMGNGNSLNSFYKNIWNNAIVVYFSEDYLRNKVYPKIKLKEELNGENN